MIHIVPLVSKESRKLEVDHLYINLMSKMQLLLARTNDLHASYKLLGLLLGGQSLNKGIEALIAILLLF